MVNLGCNTEKLVGWKCWCWSQSKTIDETNLYHCDGQHALGCANGKKEAERIRKGIKNLSGDGEEGEEEEEEGGESRV